MKKTKLVIAIMTVSAFLFNCGNIAKAQEIKIGTQTWAIENLTVITFSNGDTITEAKTDAEWIKAGEEHKAAWCNYNNDTANGNKYGKLYNWYAVKDPRGIAPKGWHIPDNAEWSILNAFLGYNIAGKSMKTNSGWEKKGNGSNKSGFTGLPGGTRASGGGFNSVGFGGYFWSTTEEMKDYASVWLLAGSSPVLASYGTSAKNGLSVRCLKD